MKKSGIREDEIRMVVGTAEETGVKMRDADDESIFIAKLKIADVFYYAEYRAEGDGFRILDAYWHKTDVTGW